MPGPNFDGSVKCRNCGEIFESKSNLMVHRKIKHSNTVAFCRNYANKTCLYSSKMCWWNHSKNNDNGEEKIKCYVCSKTFQNMREMMIHRKKDHRSFVSDCNLFMEDKCKFKEESCWFNHREREIEEEIDADERAVEKDVDEPTSESVFRNAQENLEPPLMEGGEEAQEINN